MGLDALYFRVSSDHQTTENQFEDLLQVAERDGSGRDWGEIRRTLSDCVYEEQIPAHDGGPRHIANAPRIAFGNAPYCRQWGRQ